MSRALSRPEAFAPLAGLPSLPDRAALVRARRRLAQRLALAVPYLRSPALAARRGAAELYAIGFDRLCFALAVALAMYLAGWLLGNMTIAPVPPMPVTPPAPVTGTLSL